MMNEAATAGLPYEDIKNIIAIIHRDNKLSEFNVFAMR